MGHLIYCIYIYSRTSKPSTISGENVKKLKRIAYSTNKQRRKQTGQIKGQIHHRIFRMNIRRSEDRLEDGRLY